MLHVLFGPDSFSLQEALAELKAELDADGMLATNTTRLDGAQLQPEELPALCNAVPFLGAHRLVIIEGLMARFEAAPGRRRGRPARSRGRTAGGGPESLGAWGALPEVVAAMPPTTVLVLVEGDISTGNPLLKLLDPLGSTRPFPRLRQRDVLGWVVARARREGVSLSREAALRLAELVGPNLGVLAAEIEKLGAYAAGRTVQPEDVDALTPAAREANVFAMVDAVVEGRVQFACRLLEKALDDGQTVSHLFALILRHYRNLLLAKELVAADLNAQQVGGRVGVYNEFALNKLLDQASRATAAQLEAGYRRLLEADASIKRGIYAEDVALELLVADLAGLGSPAASQRPQPYRRAARPVPGV